jgi:hypothetical protein
MTFFNFPCRCLSNHLSGAKELVKTKVRFENDLVAALSRASPPPVYWILSAFVKQRECKRVSGLKYLRQSVLTSSPSTLKHC